MKLLYKKDNLGLGLDTDKIETLMQVHPEDFSVTCYFKFKDVLLDCLGGNCDFCSGVKLSLDDFYLVGWGGEIPLKNCSEIDIEKENLKILIKDLAEHISKTCPDSSWWIENLASRVDQI